MAAEESSKAPQPPNELEQKLIRQVEYYFGDQNVARDKFLLGKMDEEDGWVSLDCLITFNRLKTLSTDFEVIKAALSKSSSGLLEINGADNKIRRTPDRPMPNLQDAEFRHEAKLRTVYVKGFPESYVLDDLEKFFADKGKTLFIKMRRADDRSFKGSVFVEFDTAETAKAFVQQSDLKVADNLLTIMMKDDYFKMKNENKKQAKSDTADPKESETDFKPGAVLHFVGVGSGTSLEDLKDIFRPHEDVAWVDFQREDTEGYVRFHKEGAAQRAIDAVKNANDGKILIKEVETQVRVLEGEEEQQYHKKVAEEIKLAQKAKKQKRGGRNQGGGAGRNKKKWWQTRNKEKDDSAENGKDAAEKGDHQRFTDEDVASVQTGTKRPANGEDDSEPTQTKQVKVTED